MSNLKSNGKRLIGMVGTPSYVSASNTAALFKEWYNSLDRGRNMHTVAREIILDACGISLQTFYDWVAGRALIPTLARHQINQIAGETVFREKPALDSDQARISELLAIWERRSSKDVTS